MIGGFSVTVVIPTKNEAKGIAATIARIPKNADRILVLDRGEIVEQGNHDGACQAAT